MCVHTYIPHMKLTNTWCCTYDLMQKSEATVYCVSLYLHKTTEQQLLGHSYAE